MKIKIILFCSAMIAFASCSKDDDNNENASIVGTWNAVSLTTSQSFDYNGDGVESDDIFEEVPCFTATTTFDAEGNQSTTVSDLEFTSTGDEFSIDCNGFSSYTDTYVLEGNTLTTTDEDGDVVSTVTITGSTLTVVGETDDFGNATIVFERQ